MTFSSVDHISKIMLLVIKNMPEKKERRSRSVEVGSLHLVVSGKAEHSYL